MINVAAYLRLDPHERGGVDAPTIDEQRREIEAYCAANDMEILRWYVDAPEPGGPRHAAINRLIYDEKPTPPVERLIVTCNDRVTGNIDIYFAYKLLLRRRNIELQPIVEDFGAKSKAAVSLERYILRAERLDRKRTERPICAGYSSIRGGHDGGYNGGYALRYAEGFEPYGYRAKQGGLEIVQAEAGIIRKIFRMKERAGESIEDIVEALAKGGKLTREGRYFTARDVQAICDDRKLYLGYYRTAVGEPWRRALHRPILRPGLYD